MTYNLFLCTIILGQVGKLIEAKVAKNAIFFALFSDFELKYFQDKILK